MSKITCHHPNCDICKEQKDCFLKKPCNKKLLAIEKEIEFELNNLKNIRRSQRLALTTPNDYCVPDISMLLQEEHDTVEIIRELRRCEKDEI